jgi:hypothetical protein
VSQHLRHTAARTMLQRVRLRNVVGSMETPCLQVSAASQKNQKQQKDKRK